MSAITPFQCRMARAALYWTHSYLATQSGIDRRRLHRFETGVPIAGQEKVATALRSLFEGQGITFRTNGIDYPGEWTHEIVNAKETEKISQ